MVNLTVEDCTQLEILSHLCMTEIIINEIGTEFYNSDFHCSITALPDLGFANNISRMHGGFFTGAMYRWESSLPFVPIDATVNACGVSAFWLNRDIYCVDEWNYSLRLAKHNIINRSSYEWNFEAGNHFATIGLMESFSKTIQNGTYLLLHSSASEFKKQYNGLYPDSDNWYADHIKKHIVNDRYLRYLIGEHALLFTQLASIGEEFNKIRHRIVARSIASDCSLEELVNTQHYGMPIPGVICIGCQLLQEGQLFVLLTRPGATLLMCRATKNHKTSVEHGGRTYFPIPHGLGKRSLISPQIIYDDDGLKINNIKYLDGKSLEGVGGFDIREFPVVISSHEEAMRATREIRSKTPFEIVGLIQPKLSNKYLS